jgi:hypothetical protein
MDGGADLAWEDIPALAKPAGDDGRTPRALICAIICARLLFIAEEAILLAAERLVPGQRYFDRSSHDDQRLVMKNPHL